MPTWGDMPRLRMIVVVAVVVLIAVACALTSRGPGQVPREPVTAQPGGSGSGSHEMAQPAHEAPQLPQLVGSVVDMRDRPIAGATVTIDNAHTVTSGDDGSFAFGEVQPGAHHVTAEKGLAYGEEAVASTDEHPKITMVVGPRLVVHLVDRAGAPVAGVRVSTGGVARHSNPDGVVTFRAVNGPSSDLQVIGTGYVSQLLSVKVGDDPHRTAETKIVLAPSVLMGGMVLDEAGAPVAGAKVYAKQSETDWTMFGESDASGHWTLDGFGPGRVSVEAWTDVDTEVPGPAVVLGKRPRLDLVLRVERAPTVGGIAVDGNGVPLAGVHVCASPGGCQETDMQGRFEQPGVTPGRVYVDGTRGELGTATQIVHVPRHGHAEVRLVMRETVISGTVKTPDGSPVPDVIVFLEGPSQGDSQQRNTHTDASGMFSFEGIPPGEYTLEHGRDGEHVELSKSIYVRTGMRDLALVEPEVAAVRGRVVLDGKGVEFFGVAAGTATPVAQHGGDGRFELRDVTPGTTTIAIVGPTFQRLVIHDVVVTRDRGTNLGDIQVVRGRTARGRVVDASGAPVAGAAVVVQRDGAFATVATLETENADAHSATTGPSGEFEIAGMPDDLTGMVIQASAPGRGLLAPRPCQAGAMELVLAATGAISGTVVNDPPGPIWHLVHVVSLADGHSYETSTNEGAFSIEQVSPGDYDATLDSDDRTKVTFTVEAKQTAAVAMERK